MRYPCSHKFRSRYLTCIVLRILVLVFSWDKNTTDAPKKQHDTPMIYVINTTKKSGQIGHFVTACRLTLSAVSCRILRIRKSRKDTKMIKKNCMLCGQTAHVSKRNIPAICPNCIDSLQRVR
jgi:hypothetical protein